MKPDSSNSKPPLDREIVESAYAEHFSALRRFLLGMLKDEATANDALQTTFIRLLEKGHMVQEVSSLKAWLFRVAYNEAMLVKRRVSIGRKHQENIAWKKSQLGGADKGTDQRLSQSVHHAIQQEQILQVREALNRLPEAQRIVVEKRIYEGLKFREIADELDEPLGTVLARMQAGLKKLKPILQATQEND